MVNEQIVRGYLTRTKINRKKERTSSDPSSLCTEEKREETSALLQKVKINAIWAPFFILNSIFFKTIFIKLFVFL